MKRVRMTVAYDGTNYHGWQIQNNGNTIESELNHHLSELLQEKIEVIGASRTDAGVHALGNVAVFDTVARIPAEKISYALNQRLPEDIRIRKSEEVPIDFHPRYCNSIKTYEYRILNTEFPIPTLRRSAYFVHTPLNVRWMKEGSAYLVGEHDFKSFCNTKAQVDSTVRTIYMLDVKELGEEIIIQISGNGFLYNMVRIIAGTLIQIGEGRYAPEQIREILAREERSAAGPTAPAHGLTLISYKFPDE